MMKKILTLFVALASFLALAFFISTASNIFRLKLSSAEQTSVAIPKESASSSIGLPLRLSIPSLGVDSKVEYMGTTAGGDMAVPEDLAAVGWYKLGTLPGEIGSAVIAGHMGIGIKAVFDHLNQIKPGDDIYIETEASKMLHFKVDRVEIYPKDQIPLDDIFNNKDGRKLNLITCEGDWLFAQQTTNKRLVVYSSLSD